jgi:hypothetical protein
VNGLDPSADPRIPPPHDAVAAIDDAWLEHSTQRIRLRCDATRKPIEPHTDLDDAPPDTKRAA